jgi:hypothetical protein
LQPKSVCFLHFNQDRRYKVRLKTFTWEYKVAEFSPTSPRKGKAFTFLDCFAPLTPCPPDQRYIATDSKTSHVNFAALVYTEYMIETEKDGTKYYQLTEAGIQAVKW